MQIEGERHGGFFLLNSWRCLHSPEASLVTLIGTGARRCPRRSSAIAGRTS